MNAQRHQRIKEVFGELCDQSPQQRRERLTRLSDTDPELAHDVEVLLKHSDTPAFDLDDVAQLSSLVGELSDGPIVEIPRPLRIGMYDVLDEIGQGGMGVVYLAQQHKPLERQVAIKVIRPGMDSRHVLARFDAERRTLAAMNHPGIASIHDAGVTDEGRPYFVMQHVQGERITSYCDKRELSIDDRLELFLKVCEAVLHAHQKGVIHRDLKPSNILIEDRDGVALPKVIDFGVAKAITTNISQETLHTSPGQLIGTPQYMSPEQTQVDSMHVDTRSDVFSLGALLYELLCGNTPIDADTLRSATFDQVCRMIREVEAIPPSRRVEQMPQEEAQQVAARRHVSRNELIRTLRGELDWITRTAMEKEPQRRYESVSALAADIRRFRSNEPVSAVPESATYRLQKFVRRNRGAVIAGSIVITLFLLLVSAIAIGAITYAMQADEIANQQQAIADTQRENAQQQQAIAEQERRNAEQAREVAAQAQEVARQAENNKQIVDFLDNLFTSVNPTKAAGPEYTLREFMDHAANRLRTDDTLPDEVRASLHNTVGASYAGLGDYRAAASHFRDAQALYERSIGMLDARPLRVMANLVHVLDILEEKTEALALGLKWMPVAETVLGPQGYETRMFYMNIAILYEDLNEPDEAEPLYRKAYERDKTVDGAIPATWMRSQLNYGTFLVKQHRMDDGAPLIEDAVAIANDFYGPDHPETLIARNNLVMLREMQGRLDDAAVISKELVEASKRELGPLHPSTLTRSRNLAVVYCKQKKFSDGEALLAPLYADAVQTLGYAHPEAIGVSEVLTACIAFQDRIEDATNFALDCYSHVLEEVPAEHGYARRAAKLVAESYDSWGKPDKYNEWLIKAGESPTGE